VKTHLISYATKKFRESQKALSHSGIEFDIDTIWSYTRKHLLSTEFYNENHAILDATRGAGYWLWKPYLLSETLNVMDDDDILVYCDAGIAITGSLSPLFDICEENSGILLFHAHYDDYGAPGPCINSRWTKRDSFVLMDCDSPEFWSARHVDASFQIYKKNPLVEKFITEYLAWCTNPAILTDSPNISGKENLPDFIAHREDQSVLSLLSAKYGLNVFRHPSQYGNHLKLPEYRERGEPLLRPYSDQPYRNSPYPTLLNHHRTKS
jgi:hypothetical protein